MINLVADVGLLCLLLTVTLIIVYIQSPLSLVLLSGIYSITICTVFVILDAVDVAFTEAAVGAGISSILFFAVIRPEDEPRVVVSWPSSRAILLGLGVGVLLLAGTLDMPMYGDPMAPAHQHLALRFLGQSLEEIGIPNVVTSVLASYRGYDTLGEVVVIFTAGMAVLLLRSKDRGAPETPGAQGRAGPELMENPVLKTILLRMIPLVILFGLYVQFHGDYGPGGGFQAGVILGAGLITYGLLSSATRLKRILSDKWVILGMALGVLLYGFVGVAGLFLGANFLDYSVLGDTRTAGQHLGIILIELGVGLTVSCTMVSLYYCFKQGEQ